VVLMGRSPLPPRADWERLASGSDAALARRCATLLALSGRLGSLEYVQVDVADRGQLEAALAGVRARHGRVRGVFHLAGVAGDGFLMRKEFDRFDAVLRPKLDGTRHLFALLPKELEVFVLYSSIIALTGGEGQGDYAAANAFMDALAHYGEHVGRRLVAINWPSWKGVGMAADFGVREDETPFVPLAAGDAVARLDRILANGVTQILPSAPNAAALARVKDGLPFLLSPDLDRRLGHERPSGPEGREPGGDVAVYVHGKSQDDLTATEVTLSKVYAAVLGLSEIDVFTSFQDMGGNSLIATHLLKLIDEQFPGTVDISDVFSYPSIDEMAAYIDERRLGSRPARTDAGAAGWEDVVDRVMDGADSIDSILHDLEMREGQGR
jgi:NAD(P)-dependent dehydrogenase (short-subunit alcohol dehydrogenase family)